LVFNEYNVITTNFLTARLYLQTLWRYTNAVVIIIVIIKSAKMQEKQLCAFVRVRVLLFSRIKMWIATWFTGWVGYGSGESRRVRWLPRWHSDAVPWSTGMWVQHLLQLLQENQRPQVAFCIELVF